MQKHPSLSNRGNSLASNPARIDFEVFMEAIQNLYNPDENPDGAFPLNIAENHLSAHMVKERMNAIMKQQDIPDWVMGYTDLLGNQEVRKVIAGFMEKFLCGCPISHDSIGLSAGAAAIIEVSSFVLANPNDVVVIPAPAYPMYTKDLGLKSGVVRYDLQTHYHIEELYEKTPVNSASLDKTWEQLKEEGRNFKILLITSPDNPTGYKYSKNELKELSDWCMKHEVHMIVNEIYGLSTIETCEGMLNHNEEHCSFAKIIHEAQSDYLHLWYAFSKDFAMSGWRIGVVHSLNKAFINGYENTNVPHMVSNLAQWMLGELLSNHDFLEQYIHDNQKKVNKSYQLAVSALKEIEVPFFPSRGSFFIWADFSKYLKEDSPKGEEQLWLDIYHNTGILLTPGIGFNHQKHGFYRLVFTAVSYEDLAVAINRMKTYLINRTSL